MNFQCKTNKQHQPNKNRKGREKTKENETTSTKQNQKKGREKTKENKTKSTKQS